MYPKKNRCLTLILLFLVIIISVNVSAQTCEAPGFMGKFQQNSNVTITQLCPTCTFLNITVTDPDSIILFENEPMTLANGVFTFGPNSTISSVLGIYFVQGTSNLDEPFKACWIITNIPTDVTIQEAIIYAILTPFVFFMFLIFVWGAVGLPARNRRNEIGRLIGVEKLKYVKFSSMFLAYAFFTWLINILLILSNNFVTLSQYSGFFTMLFQFLMAALYVIFVIMIVFFFVLAKRDLKLQEFLSRGILPR